MSYLAALAKVKETVAKKQLVPHLTHFLVTGGEIIATDGQKTAGAPFPDDRTFAVPAVEFERALTKLGDKCTIAVEDGSILLTKSRYRTRINTLKDVGIFARLRPEGNAVAAPAHFMHLLATLRPMVSDNATKIFAMGYLLREAGTIVTNNIAVARVDWQEPEPAFGAGVLVPVWAIDDALSRKDAAVTALRVAKSSFSFIFDDSSWLRTPLIADPFPAPQLDGVIDGTPAATSEITAEWREVFNTVASLCDDTIRITPTAITGGRGQSDTQGDVASPVGDLTSWPLKALEAALNLATHFDPGLYPKPCPWRGRDGVHGLIMGKQRT